MGLNVYGLIQVLFVGAFALSAIGIFVMLLKKIKPKELKSKRNQENKIACVSSLSVGHRKKIIMLNVEEKSFLIGVTEYKMETLFTFDKKLKKQTAHNFSHTVMHKKTDHAKDFEHLLKSKVTA